MKKKKNQKICWFIIIGLTLGCLSLWVFFNTFKLILKSPKAKFNTKLNIKNFENDQ